MIWNLGSCAVESLEKEERKILPFKGWNRLASMIQRRPVWELAGVERAGVEESKDQEDALSHTYICGQGSTFGEFLLKEGRKKEQEEGWEEGGKRKEGRRET